MRAKAILVLLVFLLGVFCLPAAAQLPFLDSLSGGNGQSANGKSASDAQAAEVDLGARDAEGKDEGEAAAAEDQRQPEDFPGVAQVIPRLSRLGDEGQRVLERIDHLQQVPGAKRKLERAREEHAAVVRRSEKLGEMTQWSVYRLEEVRGRLAEQKEGLQRILDSLSERIQEAEELRRGWQDKKTFWRRWQSVLHDRRLEVPQESFARAEAQIGEVLASLTDVIGDLVGLQQEVIGLRNDVHAVIERSSRALRKDTFRQTALTFFDPAFYDQFDADLWQRTGNGIAAVEVPGKRFLRDQIWIFIIQVLVALGVALGILRYRRKVEDTEEWGFILHHPWSTGVFTAFAVCSPFYTYPPGMWRLALWAAGAWSAATLIGALLNHRWKARMAHLLAALFILSLSLQLISFPQALYRLYLVLVSLAGAPLLFYVGRKLSAREEKNGGFVFIMYAGALILFASLLAQVGGYNVLSFRLIESSIKTVFLLLVVTMVIELAEGGIDFLLSREFFRRWRFFRRFGRQLNYRLRRVLRFVIILYSAFFLLEVWGVFDSVLDAWHTITGLSLHLGEVEITLEMVLVALAAIYLSVVTSWVIRSVLEAEIFPRREFDRGIRDSIKKILHYCFIVFGVFLALMFTGVELQNFAVLAGAFGIGIGFGMQNIVNNFVSGLILLFERPVKVGDLLIVDEEWCTVRKIGLRSTVVTTLDESEIIMPNSMLISEKVTNWSLSSPLCRVTVPVGVAYGSDVPLVLEILTGVGKQIEEVRDDPSPSALFSGFGNSSLDFELRVWISDVRDRLKVRSQVCQYVDRRFREEGVEIPFPQRDLHLRSVDDEVLAGVGREGGEKKGGAKADGEGSTRKGRKESVPKGTTPGADEHQGRQQQGEEDGDGNGAD